MKEIIIIGGGGHARVLIDTVRAMNNFHIKGILDTQLAANKEIAGCRVLGNDDLLSNPEMRDCRLVLGIGTQKGDDNRKKIYMKYKKMGYAFPVIQHPKAQVSLSAVLGEGVQIMAGVIIQAEAQIGPNSIINSAAVVEHNCLIEGHCHVSPGVVLGGEVTIGECSMVGLGARVLPGVKIGKGATVGAGAVVTRDVPDCCVVAGLPAKKIKNIC